jgi:hypothetical protein
MSQLKILRLLTLRPLHLILDPGGALGLGISKLSGPRILLDLLRNVHHDCGPVWGVCYKRETRVG